MFCHVTRGRMQRGGITWILAHRAELLDQINDALRDEGIIPGLVSPEYAFTPDARVQVASVFSLVRRLDRLPAPDFLIVDEAHHAVRNTTWGKILDRYPQALVLGVTATPTRLSGEGLDDIFDSMVMGPSVKELIELKALCPPVVYAPPGPDLSNVHVRMGEYVQNELSQAMSRSTVVGDAVAHYRKHAHQKPGIAFCVTVEHAHQVAEKFRQGGYSSVVLEGSTHPALRREIVRDFVAGRINVLSQCGIVSEGFDVPRCEVGVMLAPTKSLVRYLQSCGRCLRPAPGKTRAVILDHAGNTATFGLPTEDREWTLAGAPVSHGGTPSDPLPSLRLCKSCFAANPSGRSNCVECGALLPVNRKVHETEGELVEVTEQTTKRRPVQRNPASDLAGLIELAKMRGYTNPEGWANHVFNARLKKRAERMQGFKNGTH